MRITPSLVFLSTLTVGGLAPSARADVLVVDPNGGADAVTIKEAIGLANTGEMTTIMVRGRISGPGVHLYLESGLEMQKLMKIVWDEAGSDDLGGGVKAPAILSRNAAQGSTGIVVDDFGHTRTNTIIDGLVLDGYAIGIAVAGSTDGITIRNAVFSQCTVGVDVTATHPLDCSDPLIKNCTFDTLPAPFTVGNPDWIAPPVGEIIFSHVLLLAMEHGKIEGRIKGCSFLAGLRLNTTASLVAAPGPPNRSRGVSIIAGFGASKFASPGIITTEVYDCLFSGNSDPAFTLSRGIDVGLGSLATGPFSDTDIDIKRCRFERCGVNGATLWCWYQGRTEIGEDEHGWPEFPRPGNELWVEPSVTECTFVDNGFVSITRPDLGTETSSGLSIISQDGGRMAAKVVNCDSTGTHGGQTAEGIARNADAGVHVIVRVLNPDTNGFEVPPVTYTVNESVVETSDVWGNGFYGLEVSYEGGSGRPVLRRNRLYNNGLGGAASFVTGLIGLENPATEIVNNFVYNLPLASLPLQPMGIEGTHGPLGPLGIVHNSIYGQANGMTIGSTHAGSVVGGNVVENSGGADYVLAGVPPIYNCGSGLPPGNGNIDVDPAFVQPLMGDLHLGSGSPVRGLVPGMGGPLEPVVPTNDIDGDGRPDPADMGADETL